MASTVVVATAILHVAIYRPKHADKSVDSDPTQAVARVRNAYLGEARRGEMIMLVVTPCTF